MNIELSRNVVNNFTKLIEMLETIFDETQNMDEYYEKLLELAIKTIPEADYGSLIMIIPEKNSWIWLATVGHNKNLLCNMTFYINRKNLKEGLIFVDGNILEKTKENMSEYSYRIIKKASTPIKQTIAYHLKITEKIWMGFALDIDANSNKTFSEDSINILKLFGNLAKIFLKNKIEKDKINELNKELKFKNYEYQKLNEEMHNKYKIFIDSIHQLSQLLISSDDEKYLIKESLRICAKIIPFFEKAIFAKRMDNKIIIKDSIGYENLMVEKLKIKREFKEKNMNIITFSEIEGDFYQIKVVSSYYIFIKLNEKNREYLVDKYDLSSKYENILYSLIELKDRLNKEKLFSKNLIKAFINLFDKNTAYKLNHSEKTAYYATLIGKEMGFDEKQLEKLYWAAILHDIGKIGIPQNILVKSSALTLEEYENIKKHTLLGYNIILKYLGDKELAKIVKYHHERCDGKGYPEGLKCKEIPLESKIIAVADAYAEMITKKAYRTTLLKKEAIKRIKENSGTQFDPMIVDIFINYLESKK
ncbi:HD-GYP domain-containing protein [Marinitoga aeolica]|uniref:HD-GYP domain-containing protein n=1 Tax=Marinitoga aeolica TaxID=2809031 RepID=A0ABY8PTB3_9BACT|nr:HD-GYP domain-containing protein [Marinitoga aeolica]WGS65866.1 HD-GYP domain-containing protein [Marinitoga aeolica]